MGKASSLSLGFGTAYLGGQQVSVLPANAISGDWGLTPMANAASLTWPANLAGASPATSMGSAVAGSVHKTTSNPELNRNVAIIAVVAFVIGALLLYKYAKA